MHLFIINIVHGVQDRQEQKQRNEVRQRKGKQREKFTVSQIACTVNEIICIIIIVACKPLRQHQQAAESMVQRLSDMILMHLDVC